MKLWYLDIKSCHALLPPGHGLPLSRRLEEYLQQINSKEGKLNGLIDVLIRRNEKTKNMKHGSERLCNSPLDIAQASNIEKRTINTQAIERLWPGPARLHTVMEYNNGIVWKTIVPLQFLLKGWGDASRGHQCYIHTISHNMSQIKRIDDFKAIREADKDSYYYVGITGRNWLLRLSEHIGEMHRGSRKKFHAAWRESMELTDVLFTSCLMDINLIKEDAMNWEERYVDKVAYGPNGLNMIPGGFKGLKFLHKHRFINRTDISLEERDRAIAEYVRRNPKKGIPHPFMAELWKDDDFYIKNIGAKQKTLTPDQVRKIRELNKLGSSITEITEETGALNEVQVKNVIAGKTYGRIQ